MSRAAAMPRHAQPLYEPGTATLLPVTTPEGVPLEFRIATAGARAGAVLMDYLIIFVTLFVLLIIVGMTGVLAASSLMRVLVLVGAFLLLNFYFVFFEVRWQGATPGKRMAGIRVINRTGGPVTGDAILTRNFLRLIEMFVPLEMLNLQYSDTFADVPWYLVLLGILWSFLLTFLPLFNKYRMRLGDIAAGTVVVQMPKHFLLEDVGQEGVRERRGRAAAYTFTREQLDVYGEYELQVLEELLRNTRQANWQHTVEDVTDRIREKIGYHRHIPPRQCMPFLQAYYEALRAHREQRMLYGRRKQDKHASEE